MKKKIRSIAAAVMIVTSFFNTAFSQIASGGPYTLDQAVIATGGGLMTGTGYSINGTYGQSAAGNNLIGSPYGLRDGFWDFLLVATPTPTATATSTPTNTATPTNTPTPPPVISGTVTYGNAIGSPATRFVSNVLMSGTGSVNVSTTTDFPGGNYSLSGFGSGSYIVTPTKTTGQNGITSFDAGKIAQHVAGVSTLTGNQLVVADVSNNGAITSFDAANVANYVVSAPNSGRTGFWRFNPINRIYASITNNVTGQDYSALLMGEVSGNWTNTGARSTHNASDSEKEIMVNAPRLVTPTGQEIIVPVDVSGASNNEIISYEFHLRYDPTVIQPQTEPVDVAGTSSRALSVVTNASEPGLLRVVVYGAIPIEYDGVLLNLKFTAVGPAGSVSPLIWERIMFNEDEPSVGVNEGEIELF